jgi:hypothetical protein
MKKAFPSIDFEEIKIMSLSNETKIEICKKRGVTSIEFLNSLLDSKFQEITQTPLLLSMIIEIYKKEKQIPDNRSILYKMAIDSIISLNEKKSKKIKFNYSKIEKDKLYEFLCDLANWMQSERIKYFSSNDIKERFKDIYQDWIKIYKRVIDEGKLSIIVSMGNTEKYRFYHLSFQEYLTSLKWIKKIKEEQIIHQKFKKKLSFSNLMGITHKSVFLDFLSKDSLIDPWYFGVFRFCTSNLTQDEFKYLCVYLINGLKKNSNSSLSTLYVVKEMIKERNCEKKEIMLFQTLNQIINTKKQKNEINMIINGILHPSKIIRELTINYFDSLLNKEEYNEKILNILFELIKFEKEEYFEELITKAIPKSISKIISKITIKNQYNILNELLSLLIITNINRTNNNLLILKILKDFEINREDENYEKSKKLVIDKMNKFYEVIDMEDDSFKNYMILIESSEVILNFMETNESKRDILNDILKRVLLKKFNLNDKNAVYNYHRALKTLLNKKLKNIIYSENLFFIKKLLNLVKKEYMKIDSNQDMYNGNIKYSKENLYNYENKLNGYFFISNLFIFVKDTFINDIFKFLMINFFEFNENDFENIQINNEINDELFSIELLNNDEINNIINNDDELEINNSDELKYDVLESKEINNYELKSKEDEKNIKKMKNEKIEDEEINITILKEIKEIKNIFNEKNETFYLIILEILNKTITKTNQPHFQMKKYFIKSLIINLFYIKNKELTNEIITFLITFIDKDTEIVNFIYKILKIYHINYNFLLNLYLKFNHEKNLLYVIEKLVYLISENTSDSKVLDLVLSIYKKDNFLYNGELKNNREDIFIEILVSFPKYVHDFKFQKNENDQSLEENEIINLYYTNCLFILNNENNYSPIVIKKILNSIKLYFFDDVMYKKTIFKYLNFLYDKSIRIESLKCLQKFVSNQNESILIIENLFKILEKENDFIDIPVLEELSFTITYLSLQIPVKYKSECISKFIQLLNVEKKYNSKTKFNIKSNRINFINDVYFFQIFTLINSLSLNSKLNKNQIELLKNKNCLECDYILLLLNKND